MTSAYSKHKDLQPEETVRRIQNILSAAGLPTEVAWSTNEYEGAWSNRITLTGTDFGTNGKGATREYALASGYGELMERMQNNLLTAMERIIRPGRSEKDFLNQPDERLTPAAEIIRRHRPGFDDLISRAECSDDSARQQLLEKMALFCYGRTDGLVPEIPFADVFRGEIVWLPASYLTLTFGSNGMASGNTLAEGLVQGLSEVFERYITLLVLQGRVTPPLIPREILNRWDAGETIARIEESSRYRVHVYDCSLGRGYPVVMTLIADRLEGTFGINFGAPSFPAGGR